VLKHEEKVAQQKASEQQAAETAAQQLQKKLSNAERRAEDALSAKTSGLTEYIKTIGVSPPTPPADATDSPAAKPPNTPPVKETTT